MPSIVIEPTRRVKIAEFAIAFSKGLPDTLKISETPLEKPIIVKSTRLDEFEKAIAVFDWDNMVDQPQINIQDPRWVEDILGAALFYQAKNKKANITVCRDFVSAS